MNRHNVKNPYGLSHTEVDVMDIFIVNAYHKAIAERLGVKIGTVAWHVSRATRKIGEGHPTQAAIKWAEWRKGDGNGVPA